jgi:hypothetical protein
MFKAASAYLTGKNMAFDYTDGKNFLHFQGNLEQVLAFTEVMGDQFKPYYWGQDTARKCSNVCTRDGAYQPGVIVVDDEGALLLHDPYEAFKKWNCLPKAMA